MGPIGGPAIKHLHLCVRRVLQSAGEVVEDVLVLAAPDGVAEDVNNIPGSQRPARQGEMRALVRQRLRAMREGKWLWCLRSAMLRGPADHGASKRDDTPADARTLFHVLRGKKKGKVCLEPGDFGKFVARYVRIILILIVIPIIL